MRKIVYMLVLFLMMIVLLGLPSGALVADAYAEDSMPALALNAQKGGMPSAEGYLADGAGYEDESLHVNIEQVRAYDTTILVARIAIKDASQLRTAMAGGYGSSTQVPGTNMTKRVNAVFAVNGDYFNFNNKGYVVRQGKLYRDNLAGDADVLLIDDKGDFHVVRDATTDKIALFGGTIVNSFCFGPALVVDGEMVESRVIDNIGFDKKTQRMVVGQTGPLEYICVATEGPENKDSVGLTIAEIREFMGTLGCQVAYNLDGGSSSTMVLNNKKINALSTGKTRSICDILYFATLISQ
ncbi:MAG: phosphodiester glycosidase family protein [Clostridia bacterium]